jgi:hypothetical protein
MTSDSGKRPTNTLHCKQRKIFGQACRGRGTTPGRIEVRRGGGVQGRIPTRHALRRLRKSPAFATTAILTLALGIGTTTSIFTLVYAVLLKSLPVSNPTSVIGWATSRIVVFGPDTAREVNFRLSRMSSIGISVTIPTAFRNWRRSRRAERFLGYAAHIAQLPQRATQVNSFPAITSRCSE